MPCARASSPRSNASCWTGESSRPRPRLAALLKELSTPGAVLHISVKSDRFRNFYAEWSPSISEGRVIKLLDSKRDVENADEIPEGFWLTPEFQRELVSDLDNPPVTISVGRPLTHEGYLWSNSSQNRFKRAVTILRRLQRNTWRCAWCWEDLQTWRRSDARYCCEGCRKRAARQRRLWRG